ncbi:MAG: hypothetical protein K6G65_08100 [Lachnospiraceae bacterium]|nr:hypothetical protein [Lachnospiraceae bacterium]
MEKKIKTIFDGNIELLERADKTIYFLRRQQMTNADPEIVGTIDFLHLFAKDLIEVVAYFEEAQKEFSADDFFYVLQQILDAVKTEDYVWLADLFELKLVPFICMVQEIIIQKEGYTYQSQCYHNNLDVFSESNKELYKELKRPTEPEKLLKNGYSVEFTTSGRMTLARDAEEGKRYFHTNGHIALEAFLLADSWKKDGVLEYHIYGLGMSYPVWELKKMCPEATIYVYENHLDIIRLAANFVDMTELWSEKVVLVYDPDLDKLKEAYSEKNAQEDVKFVALQAELAFVEDEEIKNLFVRDEK